MTRQCGGCTLCCKLIPVEEIDKPAGVRCINCNTGKGCRIYATRPVSCREWSCLWIKGTEDGGELKLRRPDRSHYVIDETPDIIRITDNETGEVTQFDVMQIWCDPNYPMAVEDDPDLLAMLDRVGIVALVRFNSQTGYAIFPPSRSPDGKWHRSKSESAVDLADAQREARFRFWRDAMAKQRGT